MEHRKILRTLLNKYKEEQNIEVPFSIHNTILLDNEAFRYLALRQNGIKLNDEQKLSYEKSWDHSVGEYSKLMGCIVKCPLHAVSNTLSLNEAEQLVRKLTRPIAETVRLIEQNLQLAKQHKQNPHKKPNASLPALPQYTAHIQSLSTPGLLCTNEKCRQWITDKNERRIEHSSKCYTECYLEGTLQEAINDERIKKCKFINRETGKSSFL